MLQLILIYITGVIFKILANALELQEHMVKTEQKFFTLNNCIQIVIQGPPKHYLTSWLGFFITL